jgi:hypothetical protein
MAALLRSSEDLKPITRDFLMFAGGPRAIFGRRGITPSPWSRPTAALAYVERNPVRAGMTPTAADYPWSSAWALGFGRGTAMARSGCMESALDCSGMAPDAQRRERGRSDRVELQEATLSGLPLG